MKRMILLSLLTIFMETTVIPYPVTLIPVMLTAIGAGEGSLWWAFSAGLILDFMSIRHLGLSSLYFLAVCFIIIRYRQKFYLAKRIYSVFFILAASLLYSLLFYRSITFISALVIFAAGSIMVYLSARFFPETIGSKQKLAV